VIFIPKPVVNRVLSPETGHEREAKGYVSGCDAGKKTKGRKRHLLVDTLGFL